MRHYLKSLFVVTLAALTVMPAWTDTLTIPYSFVAGTAANPSQVNANYSAVATVVNGNLDDNNIKTSANIATSKLNLTSELPVLRAASNRCVSAGVTGDTVPRVTLTSSGLITFGAGGGSAQDVSIKRKDGNTISIRNAGDSANKNLEAAALALDTALPVSSGGTGLTSPGTSGNVLTSNGSTWVSSASSAAFPQINGGRLTLTTATPVTTSDVTAATTVYFTPFNGHQIALYDGSSAWNVRSFSELSSSLSGLTANTNYDVFVYDNSGSAAIDTLTAWTNATTRATGLVYQNGVLVKSGATTRRYVGTIRITATTGQCEDSAARRYCWNYYNRVPRMLKAVDSTDTWSYTSTTWRPFNNSTTDGVGQVSLVTGYAEEPLSLQATALFGGSSVGTQQGFVGIGVDSTTTSTPTITAPHIISTTNGTAQTRASTASYFAIPTVGKHTYSALEKCEAANTLTFCGDNGDNASYQSGMIGFIGG